MGISENFLFFIWQYKLLKKSNLVCIDSESLHVIHPGHLNKHAGPDFTEAKLLIDNTLWAGNVEIHVKASDWFLHKHHHDRAYDTVILHVVYEHDRKIINSAGQTMPTLVTKGLFDERLLQNYSSLIASNQPFPCKPQLPLVDNFTIKSFLSRLVIERMENKSNEVLAKVAETKGDWNAVLFYFLARNFGFKVNAPGFELLTASLPYQLLERHGDNQLQIEALLFGQAGFLKNSHLEDYPRQLHAEYQFLKHKHNLIPIEVSVWKFLRMRPANFPTVRLAQFAALQSSSKFLFSLLLEIADLRQLVKLFANLPVHSYWKTHYHFNKETTEMKVEMGKGSIENILINTVCVILFSYGKFTDNYELTERALSFLEQIAEEKNSVLRPYAEAGMIIDSAFSSQAVLQLNKFYCTQKKCLNCGIGIKILKR